jgi:hypothetical protein
VDARAGTQQYGGGSLMSENTTALNSHTAPPGFITFTAVDQNLRGHSVMIPTSDYRRMARGVKKTFASMSRIKAAKGSIEIIKNMVGCDGRKCKCDIKNTLPAFIALMLKHPDKGLINPIIRYVEASVKSNEGAHITLHFFGDRDFGWEIGKPQGIVQ